jgi:hypothetical protein
MLKLINEAGIEGPQLGQRRCNAGGEWGAYAGAGWLVMIERKQSSQVMRCGCSFPCLLNLSGTPECNNEREISWIPKILGQLDSNNNALRSKTRQVKLYYDRRSVGQAVLVSGTHLGPATNFFSFFNYFFTATDFVMWGRVVVQFIFNVFRILKF